MSIVNSACTLYASSVETFGQRLKRLREARGLTQQQLATRAGMSLRQISYLETGGKKYPRAHNLEGLARELGVHVNTLLADAVIEMSDGEDMPPAMQLLEATQRFAPDDLEMLRPWLERMEREEAERRAAKQNGDLSP